MIKIESKNEEKIMAEIAHAEKGCRKRLATWDDNVLYAEACAVMNVALQALPKRLWTGATATYIAGEKFSASYNGTPMATEVTITRKASGWYYVSAKRTYCPRTDQAKLYLSVGQDVEVALRIRKNWVTVV